MRMIGFSGGALMSELGSVEDMKLFFYCIEKFVINTDESKWDIIANRFYRNYLKIDELESAELLMDEAELIFSEVDVNSVDWNNHLGKETALVIDKENLNIVFKKYFEKFKSVVESSRSFYQEWDIYQAVKIVETNGAAYMKYKKFPLEKYDAVVGEPLWSRNK